MANTKLRQRGKGISGYFRRIFETNPRLLHAKNNDEVRARWLKDHPGHAVLPKTVVQNLNNLKSLLRRQEREWTWPPTAARAANGGMNRAHKGGRALEALEENIDECLIMAKNLDRPGLASMISHLRDARNIVVVKIGQ